MLSSVGHFPLIAPTIRRAYRVYRLSALCTFTSGLYAFTQRFYLSFRRFSLPSSIDHSHVVTSMSFASFARFACLVYIISDAVGSDVASVMRL